MITRITCLLCLAAALAPAQSPRRENITQIASAANGAVVSIIMSDGKGRPIAQGSGFIISSDGQVVTNYHVISQGASAIIKLPNGAFFPVDGVLAFDKARDIAVIKARGEDFHTVPLGDSSRVQVGDEVVAIGNPLSLESTVSDGIVSSIRNLEEEGGKFLQITAPISPGSSGGPLFNTQGQVIGITTMHVRGGENLNFAIPINDARRLLDKLNALARRDSTSGRRPITEAENPSGTQGWRISPAPFPSGKPPLGAKPGHSRRSQLSPTLSETLDWLNGASAMESGDGTLSFETNPKNQCRLTITEKQADFWSKYSFSLAQIDPTDIRVEGAGGGQSRITIHATNYAKTIDYTSSFHTTPFPVRQYVFLADESFAPKFASALQHAAEICGAKRSSF